MEGIARREDCGIIFLLYWSFLGETSWRSLWSAGELGCTTRNSAVYEDGEICYGMNIGSFWNRLNRRQKAEKI
jgi:hypothetical protein